jgi:hypothetical protein
LLLLRQLLLHLLQLQKLLRLRHVRHVLLRWRLGEVDVVQRLLVLGAVGLLQFLGLLLLQLAGLLALQFGNAGLKLPLLRNVRNELLASE